MFGSTLMFGFLVALVVPFVGQVGQREQLAALLVLPYTLVAANRADGRDSPLWLRSLGGVLAGVGFAIKPFFLAAWIATEMAVAWRRGAFRPGRAEVVIVAAIQMVYAVAIVWLTPEYLTRSVPLARATYWAYGVSPIVIFESGRFWTLAIIGVAAVAAAKWSNRKGPASSYSLTFGAASLGWLAGYVLQQKGWYYHALPATAYGVTALVAGAWECASAIDWRLSAGQLFRPQGLLLAIAALVAGPWAVGEARTKGASAIDQFRYPYPGVVRKMVEIAEQKAIGEPIYLMSTAVWPAFPIVNLARAQWPYSYHFLWPLPALYAGPQASTPYRPLDQQGPLERQFFETVVNDLLRVPPRLLIVERGTSLPAMQGRPFDFVAYFSASAGFRSLFERYQRLGQVNQWEFYERR